MSTVDSVAVAPSDDTEEISEEGGEAPVVATATEDDMSDTDVTPNTAVGVEAIEAPTGDGFNYVAGTEINESDEYVFTVTPVQGYHIISVKYKAGNAGSETDATPKGDNQYAIAKSVFEGVEDGQKITILVTAEKNSYTVAFANTQGHTIKAADGENEAVTTATAGTDYVFKVTPKADYKDLTVAAKVGEDETVTVTPGEVAAGVYTYTISGDTLTNLTTASGGTITITVSATELVTQTITIDKKEHVAKVTEIKVGNQAHDPAEYPKTGGDDGNWTITAKGDQTVSFKVEAAQFYKVSEVKYGETVLEAENDVYSFTVENGSTGTLSITTELDPAQCYGLELVVNGRENSAKVEIAMPDSATDQDEEGSKVVGVMDKDSILTRNEKLRLIISAKESFVLAETDSVTIETLEGAELKKVDPQPGNLNEGEVAYDITLVKSKKVVLKVKTEVAGIGTDKDVTFSNTASHMTYAVKLVENSVEQKKDEDGKAVENQYTLKAGTKTLDFTVTADGSYIPVVTYGSGTTAEVDGDPVKKDGKTTYNYSLVAAMLGETITISEAPITHTVRVVYENSEVDVTVKDGAKDLKGWDTDDQPGKYVSVSDDAVLNFIMTAADNCSITAITTKEGEGEETPLKNFKESTYANFSLTVTKDIIVTVTTKGALIVQPLKEIDADEEEIVLTPNKGVYNVSYGSKYKAEVTEGKSNPITLSKFELKEGTTVIAATEQVDGSAAKVNYTTDFEANTSTDVTITLSKELAGKTLTLELFRGEKTTGENNQETTTDKSVAVYKLSVSKEIKDADVKINDNKDIEQIADTTKPYKVSVTSGADVKMLNVEVVADEANAEAVVSAKIVNGQLEVTTGYGVGKSATLKFYTQEGETRKYIKKGEEDLTIKVTAKPLLDKDNTAAPTVKLASATDVSLTLSLGAKKIEKPAKGGVFYEIKVAPKDYNEEKLNGKIKKDAQTVYVKKDGDSQTATIYVGAEGSLEDPKYGKGDKCDFTVDVKLVHVKSADNVETGDGGTITNQVENGESKPAAQVTYSTKEPLYETNLKLKKGTTTIYTGQTVVAATAQYSKDTGVMALGSASDITPGVSKLTAKVNGNEVTLKANSWTTLGKHTIEVIAISDTEHDMYASRATIVVTVVRGIEDLTVSVPSTSLYKGDKAATMKASVSYNDYVDYAGPAPKSKKVEWSLVNPEKDEYDVAEAIKDGDLSSLAAPIAQGGLVKIDKNGKVTVDKKYNVTGSNNSFKILVKANDFAGNTEFDLSEEITITRNKMEIDKAVLVTYDNDNYKVLASDPKPKKAPEIEATALYEARLVAFAPGLSAKEKYSEGDIEKYGYEENITYTSSNKKAIEIYEDGTIYVKAPAKNVTLTATAGDGGGSKQSVKVTVIYDSTGELGLEISKYNAPSNNVPTYTWTPDEKDITFSDSAAATFELAVKQYVPEEGDNEAHWGDAANFTNYKISVSGGKVLPKEYYDDANTMRIVVNSKKATVKLTNNAKKTDKVTTYTLTNTGLSATGLAKAPKVTLSNKGTINASGEYQYLRATIAANGKNYPLDFYKGDLYAKVDMDWAAMPAKNADAWEDFAYAISPVGYFKLDVGGSFWLDFEDTTLKPGSYKLKVSVGTIDPDGRDFVLSAQPATVTVKVAKDKTLSFKPVTSYKISAKDNGYAVLTGKGNYSTVAFTKVLNANINGKVKGEANEFTKYFEITNGYNNDTDKYEYRLKLKDECFDTETGKLKEIPSKDLTGYVTYRASNGTSSITNTTKVTVKLINTSRKYAITKAAADNKAGGKANVYVTLNKLYPTIAYAAVVEGDEWSVVTEDNETNAYKVYSKTIQLQHKSALTDKSQKVKVAVIPWDSYYVDKVASAATPAAKLAIIKEYGVQLTTTISLADAANATGRIKISNLKYTFSGGSYNPAKGEYYVRVSVTEVYDKALEQVKSITTDDSAKGVIAFNLTDNPGYITITANKAALAKAATGTCYDNKGKPKTLSVKAYVNYGEGETALKDAFTFKLTMPAKAAYVSDDAEAANAKTDFEKAVAAIKDKETENGVRARIDNDMADYIHITCNDYRDWDANLEIQDDIEYVLEQNIRYYVGADSGIDFDKTTYSTQATQDRTSTKEGKFTVTVTFDNGKAEGEHKTDTEAFEITIKPTGTEAKDVEGTVQAFLDDVVKVSNNTTKASFLAELKDYVKENFEGDLSNIRFEIPAGRDYWKLEKAKEGAGNEGSLTVNVRIYDVDTSDSTWVSPTKGSIEIPALLSVGDVVTAIKKAVGLEDPDNNTKEAVIKELTKSNNSAKIQAAVKAEAEKAIGNNPYKVKYVALTVGNDVGEVASGFYFSPVTESAKGKLAFSLLLTKEDGSNIAAGDDQSEYTITLNKEGTENVDANAALLDLEGAKTKVNAWITANKLDATDNAATEGTKKLKNGVTAKDIIDALNVELTNSTITASMKDGFVCTDATLNTDGSVKGTIVLTDAADATQEVTLDVVIPSFPQSDTEAEGVVTAAIAKFNEEETKLAAATTAEEFMTALNAEVASTLKNIYKLDGTGLNREEAQDSEPAKITGTLKIVYAAGVGGHTENEVVKTISDVTVTLKAATTD